MTSSARLLHESFVLRGTGARDDSALPQLIATEKKCSSVSLPVIGTIGVVLGAALMCLGCFVPVVSVGELVGLIGGGLVFVVGGAKLLHSEVSDPTIDALTRLNPIQLESMRRLLFYRKGAS